MTTSLALSICKSISDKYGSAIVSDSDWVNYLNIAQLEVLNRLTPDSMGGAVNVETDYNTLEEVRQLIYNVSLTPSAGLVTNAQINTALQATSGDASCTLFRLLNVTVAGALGIVRFVRHNNFNALQQNVFKNFTTSYPGFVLLANGYQMYPQNALTVTFTCIKTPLVLTNTGESMDYTNYVATSVIITAVKLAGVQIRDEEIAFDIRNTAINSTQ